MIKLDWVVVKETEKCVEYTFQNKNIELDGTIFNLANKRVENLSFKMKKILNRSFKEYVKELFGKKYCLFCGKEIKYTWTRRSLKIKKYCRNSCYFNNPDYVMKKYYKSCKYCDKKFSILGLNETAKRTRMGTCGSHICIDLAKKNRNSKVKENHFMNTRTQKEKTDFLKNRSKKRKENDKKFNREHIPWNKGKTGIYSKETIEKLRSATIKQMKEGRIKKTKIEIKIENFLKEHKINYTYSFILKRRQFDFLLKDFNIIIECHGDFWHANPRFWSADGKVGKKMYETQILKRKDDKIKKTICEENKYTYLYFWEYDIHKNFGGVVKKIFEVIDEKNK